MLLSIESPSASGREAGSVGALMAEVDVVDTLDRELVLMHDRFINRTTTGSGEVKKVTFSYLRSLRLRNGKNEPTDELVPTLAEALEIARANHVVLYLDSRDAPVALLARALADCPYGSILVYHDNLNWLSEFHALAPEIPLLPEGRNPYAIRVVAREFDARTIASSFDRFEPCDACAAHDCGACLLVDVLGWEFNFEKRISEVVKVGADGIQTNEPERLLSVLREKPRR